MPTYVIYERQKDIGKQSKPWASDWYCDLGAKIRGVYSCESPIQLAIDLGLGQYYVAETSGDSRYVGFISHTIQIPIGAMRVATRDDPFWREAIQYYGGPGELMIFDHPQLRPSLPKSVATRVIFQIDEVPVLERVPVPA